MFGKFFGQPALEASLEYIEFSCAECKRVLSKRGLIVQRVLHRYRLDSSFVETEHVGQR